jgi:hypothetical protein
VRSALGFFQRFSYVVSCGVTASFWSLYFGNGVRYLRAARADEERRVVRSCKGIAIFVVPIEDDNL